MGKRIIAQRRGTGNIRFRAPSFNYVAEAKHRSISEKTYVGKVVDLVHCPGHDAPLAKIRYDDGLVTYIIANDGLAVGDTVVIGRDAEPKSGNTLPLSNIPVGAMIFNVESKAGDGGKFIRSSGAFGRVASKLGNNVTVIMPSKKEKVFKSDCRAIVGMAAGSGRLEKPFLKAGAKWHAERARGGLYPRTSGVAMNALNHPFGSGRGRHAGKCNIAPRYAPAGRKVGKLHSRRTGRRTK